MADRLYVATRKGLFTLKRSGGGGPGWSIEKTDFLGVPVTMVLPDARNGTLYAALKHGHFGVKLHRSSDGGESWEEIGVPRFPGEEEKEPTEPGRGKTERGKEMESPSLYQIWALESGGASEPGVLWAGVIPGALFRSADRGETWTMNEELWNEPKRVEWFGGGYDQSGVHSICVDPRDEKHLTLGVSCGGVWETGDAGESWKLIGDGLRADYMPPDRVNDRAIQDAHRLLPCAAQPDTVWVQHHNGIFRSADGGANFIELSENARPASFGLALAVHPTDPKTAWFVPGVKDDCRVPVDGKLVVSRTRDGGETFDVLGNGLPQEHAYDLVYRHGLEVDETGETLAFGSTTGGLWASSDGGDSWQAVSLNLPPVYCVRFG